MTCAEALSALSIASLRDMSADSPVMQHCVGCPDCLRVSTLLREQEYEAATILNGLPPMSDPLVLAEQSAVSSRRRKRGAVAVVASGAALVATIWIAAWVTVIPALNNADAEHASSLSTETIPLSCLSPQQAGDIISPYVRSHGSTFYVPSSGLRAITVRGNVREISKSREIIGEFESDPSAACRMPGGAGSNTSGDMMNDAIEGGVAPVVHVERRPPSSGPSGAMGTSPKPARGNVPDKVPPPAPTR